MRAPVWSAPLCVAVALGAIACRGRPSAPPNPRAEVAVTVDNQNFLDMDVFIVRTSGERIRIGMVSGLTSRILMVRPEVIGNSTELRFEVHPIGGAANPISETVTVRPGDVIHLTIPPS
jgi:hypothetical protein